jgi:DeoR/GlpR family transcriptional regulator of sugar metabolism
MADGHREDMAECPAEQANRQGNRVLARQRQEVILSEVDRSGGARVSELVDMLAVSDMTVRRDIETLAANGLVVKVHGGATAVGGRSTDEPSFHVKSEMNPAQKSAIARVAAGLISPGTSIAISAGTTAYAVAHELLNVPNMTVVTNSPRVANLLGNPARDDLTVILTGGVRTASDGLTGPVADATLASMHVDTLILGVHGIDQIAGLTTANLIEAATNRALIATARRVIVVADNSKWGVIALSTIATLDQVDVLVTDAELDSTARRMVAEQVGQLIVAQPFGDEQDNGTKAAAARRQGREKSASTVH